MLVEERDAGTQRLNDRSGKKEEGRTTSWLRAVRNERPGALKARIVISAIMNKFRVGYKSLRAHVSAEPAVATCSHTILYATSQPTTTYNSTSSHEHSSEHSMLECAAWCVVRRPDINACLLYAQVREARRAGINNRMIIAARRARSLFERDS